MDKHLHIVCFDVPYPVDYGGVFDLFYKIKILHELGIKIHLHCFEYGKGEQAVLNQYCADVQYYSRNQGHKGYSVTVPYIVASRSSDQLSANLSNDDYPVLMEGIHCTYPLYCNTLENKKTLLRLHNVESQYYYNLFRCETSLLKKAYYYHESRLLKYYEKKVANKTSVIAMSEKDVQTYKCLFSANDISYLPAFVPFQQVKSLEGTGSYCLYHGNLSVAENEKSAVWLLDSIFNKLKIPFVIAGKNPSARLVRLAEINSHTCLVSNPDDDEMKDLIAKAQINILPSFNETGIKLKLLNALFNGRHCVVNPATVDQTGLETACHIGTAEDSIREMIDRLYQIPFAEEDIQLRKRLLTTRYNNKENGLQLIRSIW